MEPSVPAPAPAARPKTAGARKKEIYICYLYAGSKAELNVEAF